jgi:phenylacetate-CoA ligase
MIAEIIDDNGNNVPDGERGEVVVTPLGVEGFPLVRFRTGDIARMYSTPCSCGWNTKRLGPIEGRLAQRLKYRGTTIYPESIFHVLQDLDSVAGSYVEVRNTVDGADDVIVVVGSEDERLDKKDIESLLQARLRVTPVVQVKSSGEVVETMTVEGGRKPKKFFDFRK